MTIQEWTAENIVGLLSGLRAFTPCSRAACAVARALWDVIGEDSQRAVLWYEQDHGPTAVVNMPVLQHGRSVVVSNGPEELEAWLFYLVRQYPLRAQNVIQAVRDAVIPPAARAITKSWNLWHCPRCEGTASLFRDPFHCYRCPGVRFVMPRTVYGQRAVDTLGDPRTLDPVGLSVLADLLEENECHWQILLDHLRESGPHGPYCWALSLFDQSLAEKVSPGTTRSK